MKLFKANNHKISNCEKSNHFRLQLLITIALICLISIISYYLYLIEYSFVSLNTHSASESSLAWFILKDCQIENMGQFPLWESFSESPFYANLLLLFIKVFRQEQNLSSILYLGRLLSIFSLITVTIIFFHILYRNRIKPIIALIACLIFLSFTGIQFHSLQAVPELLAIGISLLAIIFWNTSKIFIINTLLSSLCFAFAYLLCPKLSYLCFGLACLVQVYQKSRKSSKLILFFFLIFAILVNFQIRNYFSPFSFIPQWNLDLFFSNFSLSQAWGIYAAIILLIIVGKDLARIKQINLGTYSAKLFFLSFCTSLIETGWYSLYQGSWLVAIIAICWVVAKEMNSLFYLSKFYTIQILNLLLICLSLLTPLLLPSNLQDAMQYPYLLESTRKLILQERSGFTHSKLIRQEKVLSQDIVLALKLGDKPYFNNSHLLFHSPNNQAKLIEMIRKQQFDKVIMAEFSETYFPKIIIREIEKYYIIKNNSSKILVSGNRGNIYYPKINLYQSDREIKKLKSATFSPV